MFHSANVTESTEPTGVAANNNWVRAAVSMATSNSPIASSGAYSAEEVAFFAGDQQITIQARAPLPGLQLLDGDLDEVAALRQTEVPLWLALFLKRRGKCRIVAPDWLAPEQLEETLAEERRNQDRFAPLPYHYLEVAFELLNAAEDDLQDANRTRVALVDLEDTRRAKVARGLKNIDRSVNVIKLPDISAMELNRIRGVAVGALDSLRTLEASAGGGGGSSGGGSSQGYGGGGGGNSRLQAALQKRQRLD